MLIKLLNSDGLAHLHFRAFFSHLDIDKLHTAIKLGEEIMAAVSNGKAKVRY